ncbi:MAG: DUF4442 domain-containing protein [Lysobacterales bacterium]
MGSNYVVWDQSATTDFLKPAKGIISAVFEIGEDCLALIQREVDERGKQGFPFEVNLTDESGTVVAHVSKQVYVRLKTAGAARASKDAVS